jgi:hypothetical protein
MPVAHACNLATQEAEIRRIVVQSQLRQIVLKTVSQKTPSPKKKKKKKIQAVKLLCVEL